MPRIPQNQSEIVHPIDPFAVQSEGSVMVEEEPKEKSTWSFVKNVNPKEKIKFKNGEHFVFPSGLFVTADPKMAEQIREVSDMYMICENP